MILQMDANHPSPYRIERVVTFLEDNGVIALPTDSTYALACLPQNKVAVNKLRQLRRLPQKKNLSLIFRDIRHVSEFTLVDDTAFRVMRRHLPGPCTFILESNRNVQRFIGDKRKRIGVRVPAAAVPQAIVEAVGPLVVTSAIDPETDLVVQDPWTCEAVFGHALAAVLDAGDMPGLFSSVVDLTTDPPEVLREGLGDISDLL